MADWTDLDLNGLLPGEPITSAKMLALEENPRAIAEGASGAPRLAIKTVQASTGTTNISGVLPYGGVVIEATSAVSGAVSVVTVSFSDDGVTYYGATSILSTPTGESGICRAVFDFATASWSSIRMFSDGTATRASGTVASLTNAVDHIRVVFSAAATGGFIMELNGGESAS